ncbi:MAG: hypothetical protein MUO19_07095 [Dehalococcoidales bacterium]|nr:hypothetical protein [Dehalococcoidales bacterium]
MNDSIGPFQTETLPVGKAYHLKRGKDWIIYAGLVSEDVYSLVQMKSRGYQGFAWNLYFSKRQQDINLDGVDIHIVRATAGELELQAAP